MADLEQPVGAWIERHNRRLLDKMRIAPRIGLVLEARPRDDIFLEMFGMMPRGSLSVLTTGKKDWRGFLKKKKFEDAVDVVVLVDGRKHLDLLADENFIQLDG